jgi:uncharacterized protein YdcH (DUF465 family)
MNKTKSISEKLYLDNQDFKRIKDKHMVCEEKLEILQKHKYLNTNDEIKAKILKKEKLFLKDQMERMIEDHKDGN